MNSEGLAGPPRRSFALIRDRDFGTLFWGKLVSMSAVWAFAVAASTTTFRMTGSATWVGAVGAALFLPQLLLALVAGRLADSRGPRPLIIAGLFLAGASATTVAVWLGVADLGREESGALVLVIGSLVFGCGLAMSNPPMHSIVPRMVPREELSTAVAVNFFPTALSRAAGPALGAAALVLLGPVPTFGLVGALMLATTANFARVRFALSAVDETGDGRIRSALGYVRRSPLILAMLTGVAAIGIGAEPVVSLAPVVADSVGADPSASGLIVAVFGAGGLVGVLVHQVLSKLVRSTTEAAASVWALGAGMLVVAFVTGLAGTLVVVGVVGAIVMIGITASSIAIQQHCRIDMGGRVMALWVLATAGSRPLGSSIQGVVADQFSLEATLMGSAALTLVVAGWVTALLLRTARGDGRDTGSSS